MINVEVINKYFSAVTCSKYSHVAQYWCHPPGPMLTTNTNSYIQAVSDAWSSHILELCIALISWAHISVSSTRRSPRWYVTPHFLSMLTSSNKFSLVPGHSVVLGNYDLFYFCHNDGWLLHTRILSCGGYAFFSSLWELEIDLSNIWLCRDCALGRNWWTSWVLNIVHWR